MDPAKDILADIRLGLLITLILTPVLYILISLSVNEVYDCTQTARHNLSTLQHSLLLGRYNGGSRPTYEETKSWCEKTPNWYEEIKAAQTKREF